MNKYRENDLLCLLASRQPLQARIAFCDCRAAGLTNAVLKDRIYQTPALCQLRCFFEDLALRAELESQLAAWEIEGIRMLTISHSNYPDKLRVMIDPPLVLFWKGALDLLAKEAVAVVGSRQAEHFSLKFARDLASQLANFGLQVVSGLAEGVDTAAHAGALETSGQGRTIAVLGSGHKHIYPASNEPLFQKILASGGLVISQFEPEMKPRPYQFVNRNRVIAGLAQILCLIQARLKSGSLGTAEFALQLGREIFVVPGDLRNHNFTGSNNLIKQGAHLLTEARDLLEFLPEMLQSDLQLHKLSGKLGNIITDNAMTLTLLTSLRESQSLSLEDMLRCCPDRRALHLSLLELELAGVIVREASGRVTLVDYS